MTRLDAQKDTLTTFRVEKNTFIKDKVVDSKRRVEFEIGDEKQPDDFLPQFKTKHWDNESNFSIRLKQDSYEGGVVRTVEDKVEWEKDGIIARMYEKNTGDEDGGFEFEVQLPSKPATNIITFTVQTNGLRFYKQRPLNEESTPEKGEIITATEHFDVEGKRIAYRPENIVNSYAVYHDSRAGNFANRHYRVGKAFHIYRPHITDADGNETWGDLEINEETGELDVIVPQEFLDTAVYPVIVDPTLGYTSVGGTAASFSPNNMFSSSDTYIPSGNGLVSQMSGYFDWDNQLGGSFRLAIYDSSTGARSTYSQNRSVLSETPNPGWLDFTIEGGGIISESSSYRLGIARNTFSNGRYDTGAGATYGIDSSFTSGPASVPPATITWTPTGSTNAIFSVYATYDVLIDLEQEGFRFRADDGDEDGATWLEAQDTNLTNPKNENVRLRLLVNVETTGDPGSDQFLLQAKESGDSDWWDVGVPPASPIPSYSAVGTQGQGTTSVSLPLPAGRAVGDLMVIHLGNKYPANAPTKPTGWEDVTNNQASGGSGSSGADSGNVYSTAWVRIVDGTESGNVSVTVSSGNSSIGRILLIKPSAGYEFDLSLIAACQGADNSSGTEWSVTGNTNPGLTVGDLILALSAANRDDRAYSSQSISAASATLANHTEIYETGTSQGDDMEIIASRHDVTAGTATAAPVFTMTVGTGSAGATVMLRIRQRLQRIVMSLSSNITTSGEATTAQLTPPSGKTTGDFDAGRIQDDENPTDAIDIGDDNYTEIEFCLIATDQATDTEVYSFRLLSQGGAVPLTYTVTPEWTIGEAATEINDSRDAEITGSQAANAAREAEIHGSATANDSRDAEIEGVASADDDRAAEIHGTADANSSRDAEVTGSQADDDSRDAEIHGVATTNDARDAEITGSLDDNDERAAEVTGAEGANASRDAEIHGVATDNSARDAEIHGTADADDTRDAEITGAIAVNSARDAEVHGVATDDDSRDAEITGSLTADDERAAQIDGVATTPSSRAAEIHGSDTANSSRDAEVTGSQADDDSRDAEVHGADTANSARAAEIEGDLLGVDSRDAEIHGSQADDDSRDAQIDGAATGNSARPAEIHGQQDDDDSRAAEVTGTSADDDERAAEIHGSQEDSSSRDAEVHGTADTDDSRDAEVFGAITVDAARDAEIQGVEIGISYRGATVWGFIPQIGIQLGKNKNTGLKVGTVVKEVGLNKNTGTKMGVSLLSTKH